MVRRSLKSLAKQAHPTQVDVHVKDRLPYFVQGPCDLHCEIAVREEQQYYHLNLTITGQLIIHCQRCAQDFSQSYKHHSELAVCGDDATADRLMPNIDCIVHEEDDIDILVLVTDDLHLYCLDRHENC